MEFNRLIVGDSRKAMRALPANRFQMVCTSPPYWNLRDYLVDGQIGIEATPEAYIATLVDVFRECRRILRDDGTLWLNLGDSYAQDTKWGGSSSNKNEAEQGYPRPRTRGRSGLKSGDLCNIPHRVAAALQADGWFWRSTIIWAKRSPMPESISGWRWVRCRVKIGGGWTKETHPAQMDKSRSNAFGSSGGTIPRPGEAKWAPCPGCEKCLPNDGLILRRGRWRPTNGHEYLFLFSKSEKYFADSNAVQEATSGNAHARGDGLNVKARSIDAGDRRNRPKQNDSFSAAVNGLVEKRNPRSVWSLSTEAYKGAHFATFPSALAMKCILAGTSAGGCCPVCESPLAPVVETDRVSSRPGGDSKVGRGGHDRDVVGNRDPQRHIAVTRIVGYRPTCKCAAGEPIGCAVFDPFMGSGTVAQVARALGRRWIGSELSQAYADLAAERIPKMPRCLMPKKSPTKRRKKSAAQRELFAAEGTDGANA